ncbi:hypothetical protein [Thiolinea disciformis]|uniref:hypothetical protein n=1 Tax=Thiolinea disciformis TaxID=125614 RepID=UPI00037E9E8C|nr:hypothetical protein [Thiolinea disciformis]
MLKYAASLLLVAMAGLLFLHLAIPPIPNWLSGVMGWLALLLLFFVLPLRSFTQFLLLSVAGCIALYAGINNGAHLSWQALLAQNNSLLVMLFSVSFLRLVAVPEQASEHLPVGRTAFFKTLFGIHILGAIINLSMLMLVASRYQANGLLNRATVTLMGQAFSAAALWSPFFASMGVALTYAQGAQLFTVMAYGLVLTTVAFLVMSMLAAGRHLKKLESFSGYPIQVDSLFIPILLAVSVLSFHAIFPETPVLILVSSTAISLSLSVVYWRIAKGKEDLTRLKQHLLGSSERMARELALFLGAGVLTVGLQTWLSTIEQLPRFDQLGLLQAPIWLGLAILVSFIGVHPIISVAVCSQLLSHGSLPPSLLAALFLSMWSLGVVATPFSGTYAMLRGQFGISSWDVFRWNFHYVWILWSLFSLCFLFLLKNL